MVCRVNVIVHVVMLLALSFTTTCNTYAPSAFAVTVGFCAIVELKVMIPGHETCDRVYHEMPEISPVTTMLVAIPVFVVISDPMLMSGALLSILYICDPVLILPALSMTQA